MVVRLAASAALAALATQAQAPPPVTPSTSPFAAAAIRRPPGYGTSVALTFAWPPGTVATIHAERTRTTETPDGPQTSTGAVRYRMRVSAHKEGRLIEYDGFEPVGVTLAAPAQAALVQMFTSLVPSLIVRETGEFVRVGDLVAIRAAMRQLLASARKRSDTGEVPPNLEAALQNLTSDEVLTQTAAAEWQALAGAYVGFSGTIGEVSEHDSVESLAMLPGQVVPMRTSFSARQLAPCAAGQAPDGCVVMHIRSVVAPGAMASILKRLTEGVRGLAPVTYEHFDVVNEISSTLEPATMRPHQVSWIKTAEFTMARPGHPRARASLVERRSLRFTYEPPAGATPRRP
jgi:hypothetical protein